MKRPVDLLLVQPPIDVPSPLIPINLALLSAVTKKAGFAVELLQSEAMGAGEVTYGQVLAEAVHALQPKVVGIPAHTVSSTVRLLRLVGLIRSIDPRCSIVTGGVGATFMWPYLLDHKPAAFFGDGWSPVDAVAIGYSETSLVGYVDAVVNGGTGEISGIAMRGQVGAPKIAEVRLSNNPLPDLSIFGPDLTHFSPIYPLETHRGCEFACRFCTSIMPACQSAEQMRPTDQVLAEVRQALSAGFRRFFMTANTFTSSKVSTQALCKGLTDLSAPIEWSAMTRADRLDPVTLDAMKSAGCVSVSIGFESANRTVRSGYSKGLSAVDLRDSVYKIHNAGLRAVVFIVVGGPDDTEESILTTYQEVARSCADGVVPNVFQPYPGTPYWARPAHYGLQNIEPLANWGFFKGAVTDTRHMSKHQVTFHFQRFAELNLELSKLREERGGPVWAEQAALM